MNKYVTMTGTLDAKGFVSHDANRDAFAALDEFMRLSTTAGWQVHFEVHYPEDPDQKAELRGETVLLVIE